MNKIAFVVIIAVLSFINSVAPETTVIGAATVAASGGAKTGIEATVAFTVADGKLLSGYVIIMSTATTKADIAVTDPRITVATAPASGVTAYNDKFTFYVIGEYNVFVENGDGTTLQVKADSTNVKLAVTGLASNLITKVEATSPKAGEENTYTFTLQNGLSLSDVVILSTTNTTLAANDPNFSVTAAVTGTTHPQKLTIATAGTYRVYLKRAGETSRQTTASILVATKSGYLSMTLALVLGLFIF